LHRLFCFQQKLISVCSNCSCNQNEQQKRNNVTSGRACCFFNDYGCFYDWLCKRTCECCRCCSRQSRRECEFFHNITSSICKTHVLCACPKTYLVILSKQHSACFENCNLKQTTTSHWMSSNKQHLCPNCSHAKQFCDVFIVQPYATIRRLAPNLACVVGPVDTIICPA
jgi:hypothetical protein